jgi:plasmid stabilization system protein ParE
VATVIVAEPAKEDLDRLIASHALPASTRDRVRRSMQSLATFPLLGPALPVRWQGFRSILGPWPWMLIVYRYDENEDLVAVGALSRILQSGLQLVPT